MDTRCSMPHQGTSTCYVEEKVLPSVWASVALTTSESVRPARSSHTKSTSVSYCPYSGMIYRYVKPQRILMIIWEHEGRGK